MIGYVLGTLVIGDAYFSVPAAEALTVLEDVNSALETSEPTGSVTEVYEFGVQLLTVVYNGEEFTVAVTPNMREVLRKSLLGVREELQE